MSALILEYDNTRGLHEAFRSQMEALLRQLLNAEGVFVHSISSRTKDRSSLVKKIAKKGQNYGLLSDVTDLVGIRVITYFSDQVDAISKIIEEEFTVDKENSIDKRSTLDPDRFGYLSVHYVVSLPTSRITLKENRDFGNLKAEIQIRSILQHAWAEIEHDLGYKTKGEVPSLIRRQFARLAGLLELGDDEFVQIREFLSKYQEEISVNIKNDARKIEIDRISLLDFVRSSPLVAEVDAFIASGLNCKLSESEYNIDGDIERLTHFNIKNIAEVEELLGKYKIKIQELAEKWGEEPNLIDADNEPDVGGGISIFYLCHMLAGAIQNIDLAAAYYRKFGIRNPVSEDEEHTAREVTELLKDFP
ncbi:MAG: hypothetical protein Q7V20_16945 [Aquabacterium sp.]|uniref:GTP pyrophosphokinase n=1 Tax=Aquabacterium sp. TaxID=1872578 RepID=UPI00272813BC|nr:hypothetical protein [Aquabacterium sp.]MDO9005134.1 hypothetical protein [Aquabacterium sp.]